MTEEADALLVDGVKWSDKGGEIFVTQEAKWSDEPITIGLVNGKPFTMKRPLNEMAMKQLDVGTATALALHDRVQELEARLDRLEGKID